MLWSAMEESFV